MINKSKEELEDLISSFVEHEVKNNGFFINQDNPMENFDNIYSAIRSMIIIPQIKNYKLALNNENPGGSIYESYDEFINDFTKVVLVNTLYKEKFKDTPVEKRTVFLPHCIGLDSEGNKKEKSQLDQIKGLAMSKGYNPKNIHIVGGGSAVINKLKNSDNIDAVFGLCCIIDIDFFIKYYKKGEAKGNKRPGAIQMCLLDRSGCSDTVARLDYIYNRLSLIPEYSLVK